MTGPPEPSSEYLTLAEVAKRLRISHSSALTLVRSGQLPATDVSTHSAGRRRYIVLASDLDEWLRSRAVRPPAAANRRRRRVARPVNVVDFIR
jgi:excisionase family DNA binding protein